MKNASNRILNQGNRRSDILAAAVALFCRYGYDGTSMRDIANAVDVMPASIYYHYASKEALFLATAIAGAEALEFAVEQALEDEADPWRRLERACEAHLETLLCGGDVVQVLYAELYRRRDGVLGEDILVMRRRYEDRFRELVEALPLADSVNRTYLRLTLLGTIAWSPVWYREGGDTPSEVAQGIVSLVRHGCPDEPRPTAAVRARRRKG